MRRFADGAAQLKRAFVAGGDVFPVDAALIADVSRAVAYRGRRCFWTPMVTVLTFLRQVLAGNCSCRAAVAMTVSHSAAWEASGADDGPGRMSGDPSAYAQARARLPLQWFKTLHRRVADAVDGRDAAMPTWCGRRVYLIDGTTVDMPDTPALQRAVPQPAGQKRGCGFPQARLTAIFNWASGAWLDLAVDHLRIQELPLLRRMLGRFRPGDVLVADRAYHSYADLAVLTQRGVDAVVRLHEARLPNLRRIRWLGRDEQIVEWHRPQRRPIHLSAAQWAKLPEHRVVRRLRVRVAQCGFRTRRYELLTTLLDATQFPADAVASLYRDRWRAELNLRHIKSTLRMERLHGRSVDIVHKELLMYGVTYNLVRAMMARAAELTGVNPHRLSFAGTVQRTIAMMPYLNGCGAKTPARNLTRQLLELIAADVVPHRPDRIEPRAVKRRPKSYLPLVAPRPEMRDTLLKRSA